MLTYWLWWGLSLSLDASSAITTDTCASCHEQQYERHVAGRHARAWNNALFRSEYDAHPKAWCVQCHAPAVPEALRSQPALVGVLAADGVGCAACHVRDGRIVSRRVSPDTVHDTVIDPALGTAEDCQRCHQFRFPVLDADGQLLSYTSEPMQNTVAEHRQSGSDESCSECHMEEAGHEFPGSHDLRTLQRAVRVSACAAGDVIELRVRNRGASHHVPSGGVHRHVSLRLWRSSAPESMRELVLGRRFAAEPGGGKRTTSNTTLAPGRQARLRARLRSLAGSADEPVNADVRYVFAAPANMEETSAPPASPEEPTTIWSARLDASALPRCKN